ncbi:MAG: class II aldolase/adducin family protein [Clostridia bacterium]
MKFELLHPADQLVLFLNRVYYNGMTTTSGGNLSIMDENGDIFITPSSIDKGRLTRRDIVQVKPDGTIIGIHKPSIELPFHTQIYKTRPDFKAVLHAHPPALVAFSIARIIPSTKLLTDVSEVCGNIEKADYAIPGSSLLGEKITKQFAQGFDTILMDNHGAVVGAPDMATAFKIFETFDFSARLELNARRLGTPIELLDEQIEAYKNIKIKKYPAFVPTVFTTAERAARHDICAFAERSYNSGLCTSTYGTFSQRISENAFLITPYNKDRCYLEATDIVKIENGKCEKGKTPSRATEFCELVYKMHPEINAIILSHPAAIMAFAVTAEGFDSRLIPESYINLRDVSKVPYGATFMQPKMTSNMFTPKNPTIIVENDCVITTGATLLKAFDCLEVLDYSAKSVIDTAVIGDIVKISDGEVDDIVEDFNLPK